MHLNGALVNLACIMIGTHDEDMECNDVPSLGFNSRHSLYSLKVVKLIGKG